MGSGDILRALASPLDHIIFHLHRSTPFWLTLAMAKEFCRAEWRAYSSAAYVIDGVHFMSPERQFATSLDPPNERRRKEEREEKRRISLIGFAARKEKSGVSDAQTMIQVSAGGVVSDK